MEPLEQKERGRTRRVTTKRARRDGNRDVMPIPKSANSATPYWKVVRRRVCLLRTVEISTTST